MLFAIQFAVVLLCILIGAQVGGIGLGVFGGIGLAVMAFGFPAATMRISALRVWKAISLVPVWQIVTVALAPFCFCKRMLAIGFPTMFDLPTTTTSAPAIFTPDRISSCCMPAGVQGR